MGTQLIKGYTIEKDPIGFAGVNSSWSMYQGHKSDGDKQAVTVFTFSKKAVEKLPKNQREEYLAGIRREATSLAKYRHPSILRIIEPLVEDPKSMAFVTEQVDASLMNLINGSRSLEVYSTELDTKFHLMDLIEAISFLHNDIKTAHLGISPESIYLTTSGKWKLSGFVFSTQVVSEKVAECQLVDFSSKANASHELKVTPNIAFTAPELVEFPAKCSLASDMFSLGCLLYSIFKIAKDGNAKAPYIVNASSYTGYKECIKYVEKEDLSFIPDGLRHIVSRMIKYDMANRCKISDFSSLAYFNDPLIQTIKYLETLYQRDIQQQQAFLKGLQKIMLKFEPKFIKKKVLPILANLMKTPQLSTCIIPIYISILENKDNLSFKKDDFDYLIWPSTKTLAQGKEMPAQSLYLLVLNLKLISEFITIEDVNNIFVPLIIKCFECNVAKLQRTALKNVEFLTKKLEYSQIKTKILPRILMLCVDNNIEVRKSAILTLQKTFTIFDRTTINDQILTTLEKVRKMGNNQAINMAVLKIFEGVASIIGIDIIASKILPSMIPMLVDQSVSKSEFKAYYSTVQAMLRRIEEEQSKNYQGIPDTVDQAELVDSDDDVKKKPHKEESKGGNDFDFLNILDPGASKQFEPASNGADSNKGGFNFGASSGGGFDMNLGGSGFGNQNVNGGSSDLGFNFGSQQTKPTTGSTFQTSTPSFDFGQPQNPTSFNNDAMFGGMKIKSGGDSPQKTTTFNKPSQQQTQQTHKPAPMTLGQSQQTTGGFNFDLNVGGEKKSGFTFGGTNTVPKGNLNNLQSDPFAEIDQPSGGFGSNDGWGDLGGGFKPTQQQPISQPGFGSTNLSGGFGSTQPSNQGGFGGGFGTNPTPTTTNQGGFGGGFNPTPNQNQFGFGGQSNFNAGPTNFNAGPTNFNSGPSFNSGFNPNPSTGGFNKGPTGTFNVNNDQDFFSGISNPSGGSTPNQPKLNFGFIKNKPQPANQGGSTSNTGSKGGNDWDLI